VQPDAAGPVDYFHLELDSHDVILAEGAPSESFVDNDNRAMFDNADEYHALYPDAAPAPARHCAPRVEDGEALETVRRRLADRADPAASALAAVTQHQPDLRGFLDRASRARVSGWAWDAQRPDEPVALEVLDNGEVIARVLANRYRADLATAGIGRGFHSFDLAIPGGLSPLTRHVIAVRTAAEGAMLAHSPLVIEPAAQFDARLQAAVAGAVAALDADGERDRVLDFLAAQTELLLQQRADDAARREARHASWEVRRRWGRDAVAADPVLRALVIDERMPADRDAGSQAILSHMRALRSLGYAVSFAAALDLSADAGSAAGLEAEGIACCRLPAYASVEEVLRRQAGCFDVVYLHRLSNAAKYTALVRQHCPRARVLFGVAALQHPLLARQARVAARDDVLAESQRVRLAECVAALSADAVLTPSAHEAAVLRQAVPAAAVHVVAAGCDEAGVAAALKAAIDGRPGLMSRPAAPLEQAAAE
jgi:hypothetical protein